MRALRVRHLILLAGVTLAVGGLLAVASCQTQPPPEKISSEQILPCLPLNAEIRQIPTLFSPAGKVMEDRPGVLTGDTDGDGTPEAVVAYRTPVDSHEEASCRRAHVRVLKQADGVWREQWDSGGWGIEFYPRVPREVLQADAETQRSYSLNAFDVRDITGDGVPELLFTRNSFGAEGDTFEAWTWDKTYYRCIARCGGLVRIEGQRIIEDFGYHGVPLEKPVVRVWNGERFVREDVQDKGDQ